MLISMSARKRACLALWSAVPVLAAPAAMAGDLIDHNGFEACWSKAITKTMFTGAIKTALDGKSVCLPPSSGTCGTGCTYTACNVTDQCDGGASGCKITLRSNAFSGSFAEGSTSFSATGSVDDFSVPIEYTFFDNPDSCTVDVGNVAGTYQLDYTMTADGNAGLYAASLDQSLVTIGAGYTGTSSDSFCNLFAPTIAQAVKPFAEEAAGTFAGDEVTPATVDESVCPLVP